MSAVPLLVAALKARGVLSGTLDEVLLLAVRRLRGND